MNPRQTDNRQHSESGGDRYHSRVDNQSFDPNTVVSRPVTQDDLDNNPKLLKGGVKVGEMYHFTVGVEGTYNRTPVDSRADREALAQEKKDQNYTSPAEDTGIGRIKGIR